MITDTRYEVVFRIYQYNSGRSDNGVRQHTESFFSKESATEFRNKLQAMLDEKQSTEEFASSFCWSGYLVSVNGIYEATRRRVD